MIRSVYILLLLTIGISQDSTYYYFEFTGSEQTFIIPDGVNEIKIEAYGAEGGPGYQSGIYTGNGGLVVGR